MLAWPGIRRALVNHSLKLTQEESYLLQRFQVLWRARLALRKPAFLVSSQEPPLLNFNPIEG
jgi:hypothetical protein